MGTMRLALVGLALALAPMQGWAQVAAPPPTTDPPIIAPAVHSPPSVIPGINPDVPLYVILDHSGSMGTADASGVTRLDAAKRMLTATLEAHRGEVALSDFGAASGKPQCGALVTDAVAFGADRKASVVQIIAATTPSGNTPLAESLKRAYAATRDKSGAQILIVTDGLDTCDRSVCAVARAEHSMRAKVVVQGVGMGGVDQDALGCLNASGPTADQTRIEEPREDKWLRVTFVGCLIFLVACLSTPLWLFRRARLALGGPFEAVDVSEKMEDILKSNLPSRPKLKVRLSTIDEYVRAEFMAERTKLGWTAKEAAEKVKTVLIRGDNNSLLVMSAYLRPQPFTTIVVFLALALGSALCAFVWIHWSISLIGFAGTIYGGTSIAAVFVVASGFLLKRIWDSADADTEARKHIVSEIREAAKENRRKANKALEEERERERFEESKIEDKEQRLVFRSFANKISEIKAYLEAVIDDIDDGRTAAKYARRSRHDYIPIVQLLVGDDKIEAKLGDVFKKAFEEWKSAKTGRGAIDQDTQEAVNAAHVAMITLKDSNQS